MSFTERCRGGEFVEPVAGFRRNCEDDPATVLRIGLLLDQAAGDQLVDFDRDESAAEMQMFRHLIDADLLIVGTEMGDGDQYGVLRAR